MAAVKSEPMQLVSGDKVRVAVGPRAFVEAVYAGPGMCRRDALGCRRPILWVITSRGRRMPVDPAPDERGVYTSHWATCPKAEQFRRR